MSRTEFRRDVRDAAWKRCKGRCEKCTAKLFPGKYHYDHVRPDGLGGNATLENCKVLCVACHEVKTHTEDNPRMTKADNQRKAIYVPKAKSNLSPSKRGIRKRMNGTVERLNADGQWEPLT